MPSAARRSCTASTSRSQPGEKLALVGESGSGKTVTALSLLRLVMNAQICRAAAGFLGRDLLALPERELRAIRGSDIAMIFQEPMTALNPLFTVGEQIAEVLELKQGHSQRRCIAEQLSTCWRKPASPSRSDARRRFPHQLSGGQRQRAMIAMALACKPKLLLADEPTTALDVTLRGQILDLLTALQRQNGMAVLMITHDLNLVRRFADRVAVMENGCIVEQGTVAAGLCRPAARLHPAADRQPAGARCAVQAPRRGSRRSRDAGEGAAGQLSRTRCRRAGLVPQRGVRGGAGRRLRDCTPARPWA